MPQGMVIFTGLAMSLLDITNLFPTTILMLGGLRDAGCHSPLWLSLHSNSIVPLTFSAVIKGGVCLQGKAAMYSFRVFFFHYLPLSLGALVSAEHTGNVLFPF